MALPDFVFRLPVLRRLAPSLLRRVAARTWAGRFKVVRAGGAAFLVSYVNYVDRQIAFRGDYERRQRDHLFAEMSARGCDVFIDVGANIGLYTVLAARRPDPPRVIAFEPDPRNYDQLRANLLLNGLTFAVETHALAVSDRASVGFRMESERSTGQSRVDDGPGTVAIPAVRLDEILPLEGRILFIKIDIEGHELSALAGMRGLLGRNRCFLQIECFADKLPAVAAFLAEAGCSPCGTIESDRFFSNF